MKCHVFLWFSVYRAAIIREAFQGPAVLYSGIECEYDWCVCVCVCVRVYVCRRTAQQSHTWRCIYCWCRQLARLCRLVSAAMHRCWLRPEWLVMLAPSRSCGVHCAQGLPAGRQPLPHTSMSDTSSLSALWLVQATAHVARMSLGVHLRMCLSAVEKNKTCSIMKPVT